MLDVRMFGSFEILDGDRRLGPRDFGAVKPKQILEILLADRGHPVSKDRLADLVWGEDLPRDYLASLESYISVLRRRLQPSRATRESVIVTERGAYRIDAQQVRVDLDVFDDLVAQAVGGGPGSLALLVEAAELARGDVLEDEPYADWADELRATYRGRLVHALLDAAQLSLEEGSPARALDLAERVIGADPVAEAAYRMVMTASYRLGRREDALRAYDRCERALREAFDVEPLEETVALRLAIEQHDDRVLLLAPTRAVLAPEGSRVVPFLGRSDEVAELGARVDRALDGSFTLVLVEGEPGIGKTRLVDEALSRRPGLLVGRTRCTGLTREVSFLAIALALEGVVAGSGDHAVRSALGALAPLGDLSGVGAETAGLRALELLAALVDAERPVVLVIDDLDRADAPSVAALGYLRRRCPGAPVAVIATCTPEAARTDPLRHLEPDLRLCLEPLTREDLAPLGVPHLHQATGGHPLFVTSFLETGGCGGETGISAALRDRVAARYREQGPLARRVLVAAAVLEERFDPCAVAALLGADPIDVAEELERLCECRFVRIQDDGFAFRHDAVRAVLLDGLSPARRALLAQRAAKMTAVGVRSARAARGPAVAGGEIELSLQAS